MARHERTAARRSRIRGLIAAVALISLGGIVFSMAAVSKTVPKKHKAPLTAAERLFRQGRSIFRNATFGDEKFWGGALQLQKAIEGQANGGVGPGVSPKTALAVGLKVDATKIPAPVAKAIKAGKVDLDDPATTLALLKLDAVVGVKGHFEAGGKQLKSIGITCAICHSTVNNSFAPGIGERRDGWPNRDLNVGAIIALSPTLPAEKKAVYLSWGPGKYDPRFNIDGKNIPVVIPPAFGLRHVKREIYTGDDTISYWNDYVAVTQMHGHGHFADPRIDVDVNNPPELVAPALGALRSYQFSLETPEPLSGSFDRRAAQRGRAVFNGVAKCNSCHLGSTYTDVNAGRLHTPAEVGQDPAYALRSATKLYRTTPLRGLWHPPQLQGPYFHDGNAATLEDVVEHYVRLRGLSLTPRQKADLVEFLKTL